MTLFPTFLSILLFHSISSFLNIYQSFHPLLEPHNVFTGIIESIGSITEITPTHEYTIHNPTIVQDATLGCSIAINGACLTVTKFNNTHFQTKISQETLRRTNFHTLETGSSVNLERACQGRNSGHYVQGHIDGVGHIIRKEHDGDEYIYTIQFDDDKNKLYIVEKGYICIDGVSLTVCHVEEKEFSIMLVKHSRDHVIMGKQGYGDSVNIEVDVMGKYLIQQQKQFFFKRIKILEEKMKVFESKMELSNNNEKIKLINNNKTDNEESLEEIIEKKIEKYSNWDRMMNGAQEKLKDVIELLEETDENQEFRWNFFKNSVFRLKDFMGDKIVKEAKETLKKIEKLDKS